MKVRTVASTDEGVNDSGTAVAGAVGVIDCTPLACEASSFCATLLAALSAVVASSMSYGSIEIT